MIKFCWLDYLIWYHPIFLLYRNPKNTSITSYQIHQAEILKGKPWCMTISFYIWSSSTIFIFYVFYNTQNIHHKTSKININYTLNDTNTPSSTTSSVQIQHKHTYNIINRTDITQCDKMIINKKMDNDYITTSLRFLCSFTIFSTAISLKEKVDLYLCLVL